MTGKVYMPKRMLVFVCLPILPMVITVGLWKNIVGFLIIGYVLFKLLSVCPKQGYEIVPRFLHLLMAFTLSLILGAIFYQRWIPSGFIKHIANSLGISNRCFLAVLTLLLCVPNLACFELLFQIIPQYSEQQAKESDTYTHNKWRSSLQILRAFACIEVMLSHFDICGVGAAAVSIFFVLSGFLMIYRHYYDINIEMQSKNPLTAIRVAYSHFSGLYPYYLAMLVIAIGMVVLKEGISTGLVVSTFLHLSLIQSWLRLPQGVPSLNGVTWYLSTSLFLYLFFPFILRVVKRFQSQKHALMCSAAVYGGICLFGFVMARIIPDNHSLQHYIMYNNPLIRLGDFAIGANIGYLFLKRKEIQNSQNSSKDTDKVSFYSWLEICAIIMYWATEQLVLNCYSPYWFRYSLMILPASLFLVWTFAQGKGVISCTLKSNTVIMFIADISPYIYLSHVLFIKIIGIVFPQIRYYGQVAITIIITILTGFVYSTIMRRLRKRCLH